MCASGGNQGEITQQALEVALVPRRDIRVRERLGIINMETEGK